MEEDEGDKGGLQQLAAVAARTRFLRFSGGALSIFL